VKVTVLYEKDGRQEAAKTVKLLKNHIPDVQKMLLDSPWPLFKHETAESLDKAARLVLVFSPSITGSPWFPFLLGFSLGRGIPVLCLGEDAAAVPPAFTDRIVLLKGNAELKGYLDKEAPVWLEEAHKQEAGQTLLDQGIPLTGKAFEDCIKERNLKGVALFLEAGFSPNARNAQGVPVLCLAARSGDRGIVDILLKAGADVNAGSGDRGGSALIDSAMGKFLDIGAGLLAAGADVNTKSRDGQSALIFSIGLNDIAFTEMLLNAGADPDEPDALGASARKYAALFNKPAMTELFDKYAGQ
jgi:hypothetical protein